MPVRRAPEPESALAGRRQRTDADYAGHRDAYRQYVQHSRLQRPVAAVDPETNINIGTSYLQYVYQQFGNNRIYASAAYNAGPGRVRTWQGNSAGRIDAVAFVESIPFSETRGYVKNVLSYDAYYRYFMGQQDKLFSDTEWRQRY